LQMEAQDARQRAVEQMIRDSSQRHAAAVEANLRAERMRNLQKQRNTFTGGHNSSQRSPYAARTSTAQSFSPEANPIPEPKPNSPPRPLYTEKHESAASVIQRQFRIHQSLHTVSKIAFEFETLKKSYVYPTVIDFQEPGEEEGHVSVPATHASQEEVDDDDDARETRMEVDGMQPKLAYTAVNFPVHSYVDALEKLLMRLDGVESCGDKGVRERRRSVVREIGEETARLERYWRRAWMDYVENQREDTRKEQEEQEVREELQEEMTIDEEPVHVEHPKFEDNDEWLDVAELATVIPNGDAKIETGDASSVLPSISDVAVDSTPSVLSDEGEVIDL